MAGTVFRVVPVGHEKLFFGKAPVRQPDGVDQVLFPAAGDIIVIAAVADVAGVEKLQLSVVGESGAGVGAVPVKGGVREQHHSVVVIGAEIPGGNMAPASGPGQALGGVLVENMVFAVKPAQAVGVVEKAGFGHQVKLLSVGHHQNLRANSRSSSRVAMAEAAPLRVVVKAA